MDFRWGGDPNIVLGIEAAGVSLPIQVGTFDSMIMIIVR